MSQKSRTDISLNITNMITPKVKSQARGENCQDFKNKVMCISVAQLFLEIQ